MNKIPDLRSEVLKVKFLKQNMHKLIKNMASEVYHGVTGTYSSSQFKDLLDDEELFIKKYILKEIEREQISAFDVGNYFHTGVLEPQKLKQDCVVYPRKVRRGKDWDEFKAKHKNKAIVTDTQKNQAEGLIRSVMNSPVAQQYLVGDPEVSLFVELVIYHGRIYNVKYGKVLTAYGWEDITIPKKIENGWTIIVKVRADMLGNFYISDLKSTTGNAKSTKSMREKISYYNYDLSAALYLDMFSLLNDELMEFIWIFASKDYYNSKTYRASETNIRVGRAKYSRALLKMADCASNNWQSVDYLGELEPLPHELEYLRENDRDLL